MSGVFGTVGFKTEAVVGTPETVDTFLPVLSAGFQVDDQKIQSQGLRGRQTAGCIKSGTRNISGSFETELFDTPMATLLNHMFGTVGTTGSDPYTHTYNLGSLGDKAFTLEEAIPNGVGTTYGFKYAGCKFTDWELSAAVGEFAKLSGNISAQSVATGGSPAAATYADSCPFTFVEAEVQLDGAPVVEAESFTISVNNALRTDSYRLGNQNIRNQSHNAFRTVEGSFEVEFTDLTIADLFLAGTDAEVIVTLDNGTQSLVVTLATVKLTGELPELGGPDVIKQTVSFMAYSETSDDSVIEAVLINSESSAV